MHLNLQTPKRLIKEFFIGTLLLCSVSTYAQSRVQLYEWYPGESLAPLILPVKANETPKQAAHRYLRELGKKPDLMELFGGRPPHLDTQEFRLLTDQNKDSRALMIANLPKDYGPHSTRIENTMNILAEKNQASYILPISAELGLSVLERNDYLKQIATRFSMLTPLGGDDVTPDAYQQEHTLAKSTIRTRDYSEIAVISAYAKEAQGFILAYCRGSQITAVALGYKLIQDIPLLVEKNISHANDWHSIKVKDTPYGILKSVADAKGEIWVNSLHHQSVRFHNNGPLALAATSADGVTEATEFKNGRGLLMQSHPELMGNDVGRSIIHRAVEQKDKMLRTVSCRKLF